MKKTMIMSCLTWLCLHVQAQILTIKDAGTGEALEFVSVLCENPVFFGETNARGELDVTPLAGAEKIDIRLIGYEAQRVAFSTLQEGQFVLSLAPSSISLNTVVLSATKWYQGSGQSAQSVSQVTRSEVALFNPQTAADMLGLTGRVFIQKSQQGGGSPMIRGFGTNRLLYTIDGVRMNTAIFRAGNIQNVISLDPFAMERTEVLFGSSSVMYGSDAIGAVMTFETLKPQFSTQDHLSTQGQWVARYATANQEKTTHFDINVGGKRWAMLTSFSANDFGHLKMGSHGPDDYLRPYYVQRIDSADVVVTNPDPRVQVPSGYSQINLMQKMRVDLGKSWDLQYGFHYSETSDYGRYDRHLRTRNGLPRYGQWDYGPQKWKMHLISLNHGSATPLYSEMSLKLGQQYFEESRIDRNFNAITRHKRLEQVWAYSLNADFYKLIGERHRLQYGLEGILNVVYSTGTDINILTGMDQSGPSRYPNARWSSAAAYLTEQWNINDKMTLTAGARFNNYALTAQFDTTFYPFPFTDAQLSNGALTGALGYTYRPTEKWLITANASTAFRSPNVDDLGKVFDSQAGSVVVPNPDLVAEYAYCGEVSVTKAFGERMKLSANGYYTLLQNVMVKRDFQLNGLDSILYDGSLSQVQAVQNGGNGHVYGIEASMNMKITAFLHLSSAVNYMQGREVQDNGDFAPLRHVTPWFGNTRLNLVLPKVTLQAYALYSGGMAYVDLPLDEISPELYAANNDGNPYAPGWYTVNFKAITHVSEHWRISAGVENITDQRYRPMRSGISAAGRNLVVSVRAAF